MSQSAQDVATLQSQACRIAASLDAARIPGGVDLHQRVMVAVVRMQTAEEQRTQTHRQVAEIAAVLDPEVTPDAWGCRDAALKRMRELSALRAQVAALMKAASECLDWLDCDPRDEDMAARARLRVAISAPPVPNSPEFPDGSPSDDDFVTVRNTLAGSPGAASYNDAFNALLRLGLKAGKWDAALTRAEDTEGQRRVYFERGIKNATLGNLVWWVLNGDEAKETP